LIDDEDYKVALMAMVVLAIESEIPIKIIVHSMLDYDYLCSVSIPVSSQEA
jgi:hypothetical protein